MMENPCLNLQFSILFKGPQKNMTPTLTMTRNLPRGHDYLGDHQQRWRLCRSAPMIGSHPEGTAATCWGHVATLMFGWRSTWKCDFFNLLVWNHLSETLIWKWRFQFLVLLVFECNSCIWSDKKHNKTAGYLIKASTHKFMEYRDSWKQNKKKYSLVGWYYLTTCAYVFPADCYGCQYCIICLLEGKLCTYHI